MKTFSILPTYSLKLYYIEIDSSYFKIKNLKSILNLKNIGKKLIKENEVKTI
jgi:hypothetical protein